MRNALDEPQTIVVLGGTSDIGLAIARALSGPATRHVVLACRDTKAGADGGRPRSRSAPAEVAVVPFEATDMASHPGSSTISPSGSATSTSWSSRSACSATRRRSTPIRSPPRRR